MSVSAESAFCEFAFAFALREAERTTCFFVRFFADTRFITRFFAGFLACFLFFVIDFFAID